MNGKKDQSSITTYLLKRCGELRNVDGDKFISGDKCFKCILDECFGDGKEFSCKLYEQAAFGQGNEKEKMDTVYSSSLQAFLVFSGVDENHPVTIDGVEFTEVRFEYRNKVIGYPSSVDVVLWNRDKTKALFIESKLYEIVRDSSKIGTPEIGPTYFSDNSEGYKEKLDLSKKDLKSIGIEFPLDYGPGEEPASKIKEDLRKLRGGSSEDSKKINEKGYLAVSPLDKGKYVYSYGIKQLLSHIIGILNFKSPGRNCSDDLREELSNAELTFLSLYNELPGYTEDEAEDKIKDFEDHVHSVEELIKNKNKENIECRHMSYQDLWKMNSPYFEDKSTLVRFYHLDEKREH